MTLRVSLPGFRPVSSAEGGDEEDEGDADDEDLGHQRRIGLVRSRDASTVKENVGSVDVSIRKVGVLLFVGNLPFQVSTRWLLVTFRRFGNVIDVVIPGKLSRGFGRKYGFVRFGSDCEAEQAIRGMNGSLIGKWNLIVQRAKGNFASSGPNRRISTVSIPLHSPSSRRPSENPLPGIIRQGVESGSSSILSMASKGLSVNPSRGVFSQDGGKSGSIKLKPTSSGQAEDNPSRGVISQSDGKSVLRKRILGMIKVADWDLCAALALLRDGKCLFDMRSVILESCSFVRTISLIKDNLVLIMFHTPYHRGLAIDHGFWFHWFYSVKEWSVGKIDDEKRIWVECRGIPFYAWNEVTFEAIASVCGSIVEVDLETSDMVHLSSARFCISTYANAIDDTIELQVGDNIFDISVSSSHVQNNNSANKMASSSLGYQQNTTSSRSGLGELDQSTSLGNSLKRVHAGKNNLVHVGKAHSELSALNHALCGTSNGCSIAGISYRPGSLKLGEDSKEPSLYSEDIIKPLRDITKVASQDDTVVQAETHGVGYTGNDLKGWDIESGELCTKEDEQANSQMTGSLGVCVSHVADERYI